MSMDALDLPRMNLTSILREERAPLDGLDTSQLPSITELVDGWASEVADLSADELLTALLYRAGRIYGPELLWEWWQCCYVGTDALRRLILGVWSGAEYQNLGQRNWLKMFAATGYVSDGAPRRGGPVTVYRGAPEWRKRGMSWTTDLETAIRFSETRNHVWQATVPAHAVLARIDEGRSESEVIVNPNCLRGAASPEKSVEAMSYPTRLTAGEAQRTLEWLARDLLELRDGEAVGDEFEDALEALMGVAESLLHQVRNPVADAAAKFLEQH